MQDIPKQGQWNGNSYAIRPNKEFSLKTVRMLWNITDFYRSPVDKNGRNTLIIIAKKERTNSNKSIFIIMMISKIHELTRVYSISLWLHAFSFC